MAKYTITIADIDLNIHTEESPEMVRMLVSTLDRRLRDILIRVPRLSKSEAAILCAIDDCAERMKSDKKTREMEREYVRLTRELELLRKEHTTLTSKVEELKQENRIMNEIITKSVSSAHPAVELPTQGEQLAIKTEAPETTESTEAPAAPETVVPATKVMFENEPAEDALPVRKVRRRTPLKDNNKVGDMFDLLTFKDV